MAEASPACRLVSLMPFASDCFQPGPVNSHDPGASRQARLWFYGADSPHQPQTTMSNSNWVRTQLSETYTIFASNQRGALSPYHKGRGTSRALGREPTVVTAARAADRWPRLRTSQRLDVGASGSRSPQDGTQAAGFTLLETLTALALAAVIIVATTGLLHDVILHFDRGTQRVSEAEHLLQAVDRLAGDFASARFILRSNVPGAPAPQGRGALFTGDSSNVTFVAAGGVMAGPQGEEMVKLSVEVDGEISRLIRRRAAWREPHAHFDDMPAQDPVVMLEGRVDISFSYGQLTAQGALTWTDTWSGESGLPRFVRVIVREPNSGVDLLAEAPFLVRVDAPAACARAPLSRRPTTASRRPARRPMSSADPASPRRPAHRQEVSAACPSGHRGPPALPTRGGHPVESARPASGNDFG